MSLAHGGLKHDVLPFFDALGENTSLRSLDVSENAFGDIGTIGLAKGTPTRSPPRWHEPELIANVV